MNPASSTSVVVEVEPPYVVHVGDEVLQRAAQSAARYSGLALLADERVSSLHAARLAQLGEIAHAPRLEVEGGESAKTITRLGEVLEFLTAARLDRRSALYTLGGGTISDLGGLAASLYKRGIAFVALPTTLLAQVDASVGGKTAINLPAGKNLAGTFHQPDAVFADVRVLETLEDDDWKSGLGEITKTAMLAGEEMFAELEQVADALIAREPDAVARIVAACVRIKAYFVTRDPLERDLRRSLNLGHTFAHGVEHASGFRVPHGVAVALGLALAVRASAELGRLADAGLAERLTRLLGRLGLPSSLTELAPWWEPSPTSGSALRAIETGMLHDKKGAVGTAELVLPVRLGKLELGVALEGDALRALLASASA